MDFKLYKSGQGYYTRMGTAMAGALIIVLGCWRLYAVLGAADIANATTRLLVQVFVPIAVFIGLGLAAFWVMNKPRVVDFLIAGEGEMKKVNWSSRKEIIASTMVVIFVVIAMSCIMAMADVGFTWFFSEIGVLAK